MPPFHWGMRVKNHSDELILTEDLRRKTSDGRPLG